MDTRSLCKWFFFLFYFFPIYRRPKLYVYVMGHSCAYHGQDSRVNLRVTPSKCCSEARWSHRGSDVFWSSIEGVHAFLFSALRRTRAKTLMQWPKRSSPNDRVGVSLEPRDIDRSHLTGKMPKLSSAATPGEHFMKQLVEFYRQVCSPPIGGKNFSSL